jgi:antitoxin ParD1/3/4
VSRFDTRLFLRNNDSMPGQSSLNVSLTPELEKFVRDRVSIGRFISASEVVREGLRLLEDQERERDAALDALKVKLKTAAAQADRGELLDGGEVFKRLDALIAHHRRAAKKRPA